MSRARVLPSKLPLTVACPGSLQLQEQAEIPPPTREQAEGTLGHLVAQKYAEGHGALWHLGRVVTQLGHEVEIDDDMIEGAVIYKGEAQVNGRFEGPIDIPDLSECHGVPDWWRVLRQEQHSVNQLKVIEYKYGHRHVEVFEHVTLMAYASGIARFLELSDDFPVVLVVVQPRDYTDDPVREWKTTVGNIRRLVAEKIRPRVELALGPNPPTFTGNHCMDCNAKHICKTLAKTNDRIVDFSEVAAPLTLDDTHVGQRLRIITDAIKRLEAEKTGLYQHATARALKTRIAHWSMEPGQTRKRWNDEVTPEQVIDMGNLFGIDLAKPRQAVTPTQAIAKGIDSTVIDSYSYRPPGAMRLVPDDTTRTRKIFGDNKQ